MGTDSLYYIMDYSGHYYRTDKSDQLVAVAGEQDATVFTFAQANRDRKSTRLNSSHRT